MAAINFNVNKPPLPKTAKGQALGELKDVMSGLESNKVPKKGDTSVTVTRKVANSSVGSTDFKSTGKSGGTTKEQTATPAHKVHPAPKMPVV